MKDIIVTRVSKPNNDLKADPHYDAISKSRGRIYPNQMTIYHQGDPLNGFFRVNSGVVMVYRLLEDSQRQITGFYTEGDCFGLSATESYQDTAVTVATSNIVRLTMSDVRKSKYLQSELLTNRDTAKICQFAKLKSLAGVA